MREEWATARLGDLCQVIAGQSPEGKHYNDKGEGLPFYQGKKNFGSKFIGKPKTWTRHTTKEAEADDILMSVRAPVGPINFSTQKICIGRGLAAIRTLDRLDKDYLFYGLLSKQSEISGNEGAVFSSINKGQIEDIKLFLPSLPEQKRIVAILDEAFEGIDRAVANAEKNLANARELFKNYLNKVLTQKGKGWVEKRLGDIANFKNGLNFTKSSKGELIKIVGVKDFQSNYWVPINNLATVQAEGVISENYVLKKNDILTVRSNGNKQLIGRCILAGEIPEKTSHSGFTIRIRALSSDTDPTYLVHYLKSEIAHKMLVSSGGGANISSLNQQSLSKLPVVLPKKSDQSKIVSSIEAIQEKSTKLVSIYQRKLTALAELKQSLLQKAFSGELTANDTVVKEEAVA